MVTTVLVPTVTLVMGMEGQQRWKKAATSIMDMIFVIVVHYSLESRQVTGKVSESSSVRSSKWRQQQKKWKQIT